MELLNLVDILLYAVNVVILFFLLRKFLHKPISKFLAERENRISEQIDHAKELETKAEEAKKKYEALLADAQSEAQAILAKSHEQAERQISSAVEEGKKEAKEVLARALREAELERKAAYENMREDITDMAIQIAEKVLQREVTKEDNQQIIDDFFKKVV